MKFAPIFPLFAALALLAGACQSNIVFQEKKDIAPSGWAYRDSLDFKFQIDDTTEVYNLYLDIAHADTFASQNLYVKIFTRFPDGKRLSKTLSLDLFNADGNPIGKASGHKCQLHAMLQEGAYFPAPGEYGLTIHQFMRRDSLPGLAAIGFSAEKTGRKR